MPTSISMLHSQRPLFIMAPRLSASMLRGTICYLILRDEPVTAWPASNDTTTEPLHNGEPSKFVASIPMVTVVIVFLVVLR
jgi:hypothetical protein